MTQGSVCADQPTRWTVGAPTWPWLTATVRRYRGLIARTLVWAVVGGVDRDVPDVVRGVCERVGDVVGDVADPGQRLVPASP